MKSIDERARNYASMYLHPRLYEEAKQLYIKIATEQKEIDDADLAEVKKQRDAYYDELLRLRQERVTLIEKVIWLIEDSYPDTIEWTHEELVRNINEDLVRRAKMLNEMFKQQ